MQGGASDRKGDQSAPWVRTRFRRNKSRPAGSDARSEGARARPHGTAIDGDQLPALTCGTAFSTGSALEGVVSVSVPPMFMPGTAGGV